MSAVWTTLRERERDQEQKYLVRFCAALFVWLFRGWQSSTYRLRFVAVATKQNSKANDALRKVFFFSFLFAILQWPHTINKTTCTNTNTHIDTHAHREKHAFTYVKIQYVLQYIDFARTYGRQRETVK